MSIIRPLALYLPQFHQIPENDLWWGEGFTEWTNVKRARPLFRNHYQPHVPHPDVGYYDLSDVEVMRRQAAMAQRYGVYGFIFYYYHFANGKRLLEKPLNNWLANKDIDFPFCYAWANENWTRAWDGGEKEVIMPQDYGWENMLSMMRNMLVDFKDPRYIKVGPHHDMPVLFVYRPEIITDFPQLIQKWREMAVATGFSGLYLISMQSFCSTDPRTIGCDAATEFATGCNGKENLWLKWGRTIASLFNHPIPMRCTYKSIMHRYLKRPQPEYPRYKCVTLAWDNTPRRGSKGIATVGTTPQLFKSFLNQQIQRTLADPRLVDNGFLLINAWNEWGEGTHLEPDEKNGDAYLQVLLEECRKLEKAEASALGTGNVSVF